MSSPKFIFFQIGQHLDLEVLAPRARTVRKKCLLFKPASLLYFVMAVGQIDITYPFKKRGDTRRRTCDKRGRDQRDASRSQGIARIASNHQKLRRGTGGASSRAFRGSMAQSTPYKTC